MIATRFDVPIVSTATQLTAGKSNATKPTTSFATTYISLDFRGSVTTKLYRA